jgi:hypothetical protein
MRDSNEYLTKISIRHLCYLYFLLQFFLFEFNSFLKKNMHLGSNLVLKQLNYIKN